MDFWSKIWYRIYECTAEIPRCFRLTGSAMTLHFPIHGYGERQPI